MSKTNPTPTPTTTTDTSLGEASQKLALLKDHTHAGVSYPSGATIDHAVLGISEQQIGWLRAVGTIA